MARFTAAPERESRRRRLLCSLERRCEFAGAGFPGFLVHACVGRSKQLADDVVTLCNRIVEISAALEKVGGRYLAAPLRRQGNHIEAVAVPGQIHHFQVSRSQWSLIAFAPREND